MDGFYNPMADGWILQSVGTAESIKKLNSAKLSLWVGIA